MYKEEKMGSKNLNLEQKIQKALDVLAIQNIMGRHMFYHAAGKHAEELDQIWAKRHEITWSGNGGSWVGPTVYKAYVESHDESNQYDLEKVIKLHPEIENKKENHGIGTMILHTLTTPIIEVAEDGETAQGVWYSPGIVTEIGPDGNPQPLNMWERYGVDFVKEDGEWKIWHIHMYYDLNFAPGKSWTDPPGPRPAPDPKAPKRPKTDRPPKLIYNNYSPTQVPQELPRIPKPYKTFADVEPY